jgi:ABC-type transport system involved in multi-copper enzyme maturation permease subunit
MMDANVELRRVKEWAWMRGFANLYQKESRAWWSTRRWWINGLLWSGMLVGLVATFLFVFPPLFAATGSTVMEEAGGPLAMGLKMFFNLGGGLAIAIGVIVLCQDLIIEEKQTGLAEWLLAKPVQRRAYVLAKLCASLVAIVVLLIALPGAAVYGVLSLGSGGPLPLQPYLAGMGIVVLHNLFYLTLTLMLGVFLGSRPPILGIALGIVLVGFLFSAMLKPLLYVTPWLLPNFAEVVAGGVHLPPGLLWPPLLATAFWCVVFTCAALIRFERIEF